MTLSAEDREALHDRLTSYGIDTPHAMTSDLRPVIEAIVARHVTAALTEAAEAIAMHACDGSAQSCGDVNAGAPCPYADAARIVRDLSPPPPDTRRTRSRAGVTGGAS
jgi:hypothetical protein